MNLLKRILMIFTPILSRIGICGNVGFISGTICGFIISNLAWAYKDFFNGYNGFETFIITCDFSLVYLFIYFIDSY